MSDNPATLRIYAAIFEKEWRDHVGGVLHPPTEACKAAARALRFRADYIEVANPHRLATDGRGGPPYDCADDYDTSTQGQD